MRLLHSNSVTRNNLKLGLAYFNYFFALRHVFKEQLEMCCRDNVFENSFSKRMLIADVQNLFTQM
jgi:hypothetical protein